MSREANLHKLEMYKILYNAYADEIKNLWQRSIFLGAFMVLVWSGYGALQLKAIELKIIENLAQSVQNWGTNTLVYVFASLGLCAVIIVLSWLWIAMAKGSKFVQEAHEEHIKNFDFQNYDIKNLFCDLDSYEYAKHIDSQTNTKDKTLNPKLKSLLSCGVLQPYRYSPSKINIALGWVSLLVSIVFLYIHLLIQTSMREKIQEWISIVLSTSFVFICPLIFVAILAFIIHFSIKSNSAKQASKDFISGQKKEQE